MWWRIRKKMCLTDYNAISGPSYRMNLSARAECGNFQRFAHPHALKVRKGEHLIYSNPGEVSKRLSLKDIQSPKNRSYFIH